MRHTDVHKNHKMVQDFFTKKMSKNNHPTMVIFDEFIDPTDEMIATIHRINQKYLETK